MKCLWKTIPPCLSDTLGFEVVLNQTEGLGIIDDASHYKPLRLGQTGDFPHPRGAHGGSRGEHRGAHGDHAGPRRMGGDIRVIGSEIRNADIIMGTQQKLLQAFRDGNEALHPNFVLLARAPSASMISSDLESAAEQIQNSGLPAASVDIHGDRDYLYGISVTLEAMGKLLLKPRQTLAGTVNLLGCNEVDWHPDTLPAVENMVEAAGLKILSRWGMRETTEHLRKASGAAVNWVVNASGFRLAKYMEAEFGIPYVAGAPFGRAQCDGLLRALRGEENISHSAEPEAPEVLVIGEQLTAGAIRRALQQRGVRNIRVLSFFDMEQSWMQPGDAKLSGEDALATQVQAESVRLVFADPDYRAAAKRELPWIGLPNLANRSPIGGVANFNMAGSALDEWLDSVLPEGRGL